VSAARPVPGAVGIRVKSGWATAVLVVGPARAPRVVDRRVIALSEPAVPTSRQPYHAVMRASSRQKAKVERRLRAVIVRAARRSLRQLVRDYHDLGHVVRRAALVVGSNIDPARIGNDHIRAHALEGQLFRTVLEQRLRSLRVPCAVTVERHAYAEAAARLGRQEPDLRRAVTDLGRLIEGPWRADEKTAALAAWVALR
jgi:hypothetical protein